MIKNKIKRTRKNDLSIEDQIRTELVPIKITQQAFDKANYVSRRICELMQGDFEFGFFLLDNKGIGDSNVVVRDIYIAHEQNVTPTYCNITGFGSIRSFRDIRDNLEKRIVGWGHSHGRLSTFYSSTDDSTIMDLLKDWSIQKQVDLGIVLDDEKSSVALVDRGGKTYIQLSINDNTILIYSPALDLLDSKKLREFPFELFKNESAILYYFYGMTFNAKGSKPFCAVAYLYKRTSAIIDNVGYEIIDESSSINMDPSKLDKELMEKIVNLRENYQKSNDELDKEYSKARKLMIKGIQLNREISSVTLDAILSNPRSQIERINSLCVVLEEIFSFVAESTRSSQQEYTEKQKPLVGSIKDCERRLLMSINGEFTHYTEISLRLVEELHNNHLDFYREQNLRVLYNKYDGLVKKIKEYLFVGETDK